MPELVFRILSIGLPALVSFYCAACIVALRPRAGTLEWIPACDRPAPPLIGAPHLLGKKDIQPLAGVCILTGALWIVGTMRPLAFHFSLPPVQLVQTLLENVGAPVAAAVLSYLLMKRLFGQAVSAALSVALMAADFAAEPVTLAFSAGGLFFLVRYLTAKEEAHFVETAIPLAGGFICLAAGCYFDPALLLMLPAAIFLCVMGGIDRLSRTEKSWLPGSLLTAVLSVIVTWILIFIPAGVGDGLPLPELLIRGEYYKLILRRLGGSFSAMYGGWLPLNLVRLQYDWLLLLSAVPALISAVVSLVRDKDRRCILILAWSVMQVVALALLGSHALSLSCAVCLCRVWARLQENRCHWLACLGAGCLFIFLLVQYVLNLGGI